MFLFWRRKKKMICDNVSVIVEDFKYNFKCDIYKFDYNEVVNDMEYVMQKFCKESGIIYFPKTWKVSYSNNVIVIKQSKGLQKLVTKPCNKNFIKSVSNSMIDIYKRRAPKGAYEVIACEENCISCARTPIKGDVECKKVIATDCCCICLEDFHHTVVGILTCGHFFHRQCMFNCFRPKDIVLKNRITGEILQTKSMKKLCPFCREKFE